MKKYLATILAVSTLLALVWGMSAQAATSGDGAVQFSVQATQELTALGINLGTLSAGTANSTQNPVTLSSNVAWNVTGIANGDFTDGQTTPTTLDIANLAMSGKTMVKAPAATAVTIAGGSAGSDLNPGIATALTVPWNRADLVGKTLTTTITYTITP